MVDRLCDESDVAAIGTAFSGLCDQLLTVLGQPLRGVEGSNRAKLGGGMRSARI